MIPKPRLHLRPTSLPSLTIRLSRPSPMSLGVYKDSMLLGAYYGPQPTPFEPNSSNVCVLQASQAAHKWFGMPSQKTTLPQPDVPQSNQPSGTTPQGLLPFDGIPPNPFPLGIVPLGLNHLEVVPPGHFHSFQIPFLFPPWILFYTYVGYVKFTQYYLGYPNLVHRSSCKHSTQSSQTLDFFDHDPTYFSYPYVFFSSTTTKIRIYSYCESTWRVVKSQKKGTKGNEPPATLAPPKLPKPIPPCVLCDVVGHATNNCPELPHVKNVVFDTFPDSNIT